MSLRQNHLVVLAAIKRQKTRRGRGVTAYELWGTIELSSLSTEAIMRHLRTLERHNLVYRYRPSPKIIEWSPVEKEGMTDLNLYPPVSPETQTLRDQVDRLCAMFNRLNEGLNPPEGVLVDPLMFADWIVARFATWRETGAALIAQAEGRTEGGA